MARGKKQTEEAPTPVEIVPAEVNGQTLAQVMVAEAEKRKLMTEFIARHMKKDVDFGTIRIGGRESKPSLFKPGSEKFLSLFKLTAKFEKDSDTWDMAGSETGVFAYKCVLVTTEGQAVGEGRGVSKLSEKSGWTINNAVKIAEKRAQIDAVLRTGALSDFFTQDLEDMVQKESEYDTSPVSARAKVTVTGADEPAKKSAEPWKAVSPEQMARNAVLAQKKRIQELCNEIALAPLLTKEDYQAYVLANTSLELVEENYPRIISRLEAIGEVAPVPEEE